LYYLRISSDFALNRTNLLDSLDAEAVLFFSVIYEIKLQYKTDFVLGSGRR